jgi:polysaccharide pyruvyl transferase WcaK-like protein
MESNRMILEITGTGTGNKGAELLLCAIKSKFDEVDKVRLAVDPQFGPYEARAKYGLLQKVDPDQKIRTKAALKLLPRAFRSDYGMALESEISGIIDASGFAFSDQLPIRRIRHFADDCKRWKSQQKTIILLPQALGPFKNENSKAAFQSIVDSVDLIYARDSDSYDYAIQAAPSGTAKISKFPDITIDIEGMSSPCQRLQQKVALLVPNVRMLDRTDPKQAEKYPSFLARCAEYCHTSQLTPKILIHDTGEDEQLIGLVQRETHHHLEVVRESDPIKLKGILKQAHLVIGSRYHALTGALSSGVPSLAVGWSHKYQHLFEDFNCPDMILNIHITPEQLKEKIQMLTSERDERSLQLLVKSRELKADLTLMWHQVFRTLGID